LIGNFASNCVATPAYSRKISLLRFEISLGFLSTTSADSDYIAQRAEIKPSAMSAIRTPPRIVSLPAIFGGIFSP
jgi:hypothetical protein